MTSELNVRPETPFSAKSRWGVFGNSAFVVILAATSLSNIGFAMFDTGSGWLMTSLNPSPRMVSAVQIATTLPLFLLTLPAGALTDVVDPRRLLIVAQAGVAAVSFAFAAAVSVGLASPAALLATSFLLGVGGALAAPAWLLILPMLVARTELDSAVAVDSAGYNLARAVGPVIAGFAIARLGVDVPFWCCWVGNLALVAALIWWRAPRRARETLPAERLISAMMTGVRYVRYSREMDATLIRAVAFFPFASAYLALLPLVARTQMRGGPEVYGALMAAIGAGSIAASFALKWLKARLGPDRLAALGTIGTILALLLFAAARELPLAVLAQPDRRRIVDTYVGDPLRVGAGGFAGMGSRPGPGDFPDRLLRGHDFRKRRVGRSRQSRGAALRPCRGRGGRPDRHAAHLALEAANGRRLNLTPSMRWRAPCFLNRVADDDGPILAIKEYTIDPKDRAAFLAIMQEVGLERRRDGGYAWNVFEDPDEAGKVIETFLIQSALELKYREARVTMADQMMFDQVRQFLKAPPQTRYLIAPKRTVTLGGRGPRPTSRRD